MTIIFSASTSCSRGTAQRTMSAPASATRRICSIVASRFAVSVFVIVWTATGAPPPMSTPPTSICRSEAIGPPVYEAGEDAAVKVYGTARGPLAQDRRPDRRAGPCAAPCGAVRAHRRDAGDAHPRRRLRHAGAARPGAGAGRHGDRPRRRGRRTRGRSCCADATERLPFEDGAFDLAYSSSVVEHVPPRAPRGVRGRGAARRARLVRADAGAVVPDRAARAAALRALAAAGAAPALLAARGGRVVGGHLAAGPRGAPGAVPRRGPRRAPRRGSSSRGSRCVRSAERGRLEPGEVPEAVERRPHARDRVLRALGVQDDAWWSTAAAPRRRCRGAGAPCARCAAPSRPASTDRR